ncbi:hypothetical protein WJX74_003226 [Apatococcus lobatus]|uniref:NECAP PHear domain-containing protein n=2 Tax=Apatococcus TaxID=904362 RepID=A0AAW1SJD5_9CHLO
MAESELRAEVVTFRCKEAYVYQVPPAGTIGHRAETWNVDKWLQEVSVQVVTHQDDCWVRLLDFTTGELFADCPIPNDKPLQTAVDAVVDSSRYFVLRLVDQDSGRHAFMGLGFREREQASNFNTALYEHSQYLRRKKEAAEMRQAYESAASSDADDAAPSLPVQDLSLKPGQTLKLKLSNSKLAGDPSTPPSKRPGFITKSGMPSPFTPGGALQIPASKAAARTDPSAGCPLPVLPPPPSAQDRVTSDAEPSSGKMGLMRVSMDQLTVSDPDDSPADTPKRDSAAVEGPVQPADRLEHGQHTATHSNSSNQPAEEDKIAADDWGDFTGDAPAG